MLLEVMLETEANFLVGTVILGFIFIFKKSQASSRFEALNSVCLSRGQRDVIPYVQMRRRPIAFSRVSTGDSDIPSSCELKDEPELKRRAHNSATAGKSGLLLSQGLWRSISLEIENTGSLSQTYC